VAPGVIAVLLIFIFIREKQKPAPAAFARPKPAFSRFDWKVRFFIVIAMVFGLGNSSDVFLILRAQQVGIPAVMIPAVYFTLNLVYSLSAVPAGMAADKFGMNWVILAGFVLFACLYYGFAVAAQAAAVWVLFALYGVFMGLTEGVQKAFLATIIPPESKATAFGVYATCTGAAMLPASLIGGWLWDRFSSSATFYFGAATAALSAMLFAVLIAAMKNETRY
jgi:MFS family permease